MSKATINFATVNKDAITMLSTFQLAVHDLAYNENMLKARRDVLKADGVTDKKAMNEQTEPERKAVARSKERANTLATGFVLRYVSTEDAIAGDIYHFNIEAFLRNTGILTGDDVDKKALKKIEDVRNLVVDRYKVNIVDVVKAMRR